MDHAGVDLANIVGEVSLQLFALGLVSCCASQGFWIGLDCFVAMVVCPGTEDGLIEGFEFREDASLMSENSYPGVFPGLGGVNDLAMLDAWSCHHNKGPTLVSR